MPKVTGPPQRSPLAGDPDWREVRDAAYRLIAARAQQTGQPALGDAHDRRLIRRLQGLEIAQAAPGYASAALWDLGEDLGRHVYSKPILEDDLEAALDSLSEALERSGLGGLTLEDRFHRTATVGYQPPSEGGPSRALWAYIGGVMTGSLAEAFNCQVWLKHTDGLVLEVTLGPGRDINSEADHVG